MVWGGVACQQPTEPEAPVEPTKYTITYLPEGVEKDTYIKSYTIESDAIVLDTNPTSPDATKPNFVAWHVDSEEGAVVTEIAKGSTGPKTFYAEFSAEEPCVVKFMSGTTEVESTKVKKGNKITLPTGFEKYSLFSDADCTKPFDTNTAITADTTIYVELKTFTISYKVLPFNEEDSLSDIPYGKVFTDEEINALAEEIDGYTYKGIFTDEACTVPFDNTKAITSDLTVYVLYYNSVLWEGETALAWTDEGKINFETPDWISANQWVLISYELTTENAGTIQICITDPWTQFAGGPMYANGKILFQYTEEALGKTICLQGDKATVTKVEVFNKCRIPNGATSELYDMSYKLDGETFSAVSWKEGSYSKEYVVSGWSRYPVVNCDDWESITIDYEVPAGCTGVQLGINGGYNSEEPDETKAKYVVADDWSCKGSATLQLNSDELVGRTFPYIFVILYMDSDAPTGTFTINDIYFTPKAE